jgi:hypothetical protein
MLQSWTEELAESFERIYRSDTDRSGSIEQHVFAILQPAVLGELNRPVEHLLRDSSVGFCFPEPPIRYPKSSVDAFQLWASGATVALQNLQNTNDEIATLCQNVSVRSGRDVTASIYLSRPSGCSFSWHVDRWDGWLIQIHGKKRFHFRDGLTENRAVLLRPSDFLLITEGEEHRASTDDYSVHLSINLHQNLLTQA